MVEITHKSIEITSKVGSGSRCTRQKETSDYDPVVVHLRIRIRIGVWGSGVWGLGVWGLGFRGVGFRGSGVWVQGFRV